MYCQPVGRHKPGLGAQIDPTHPFGRHLILAVLFLEGRGLVTVTRGCTGLRLATPFTATVVGSPVWASNGDGLALNFPTVNDALTVVDSSAGIPVLPATNVTVAIVRRKTDTTARGAALFGGGSAAAQRCGAHCPYSDGVVYFDFGGFGGANRLTVSGLSFSTTTAERWIFHAGDAGSAIWQNGIKVASQGTAITRTPVSNDIITLNTGNGVNGCDLEDINYFALYDTQWADDLCRWWSAEPYAHLYAETFAKYFFLGDVAGAPTIAGASVFRSPLFASPVVTPVVGAA